MEKAIQFYVSYLTAADGGSYLPSAFLSTMKSIVALAMLMNIIAATQDIDKATLSRLRGECVKEVQRLNGSFSFEDAVDWQGGE